jgi:hypothetical protein
MAAHYHLSEEMRNAGYEGASSAKGREAFLPPSFARPVYAIFDAAAFHLDASFRKSSHADYRD